MDDTMLYYKVVVQHRDGLISWLQTSVPYDVGQIVGDYKILRCTYCGESITPREVSNNG